jgi:hypothetical protein
LRVRAEGSPAAGQRGAVGSAAGAVQRLAAGSEEAAAGGWVGDAGQSSKFGQSATGAGVEAAGSSK